MNSSFLKGSLPIGEIVGEPKEPKLTKLEYFALQVLPVVTAKASVWNNPDDVAMMTVSLAKKLLERLEREEITDG